MLTARASCQRMAQGMLLLMAAALLPEGHAAELLAHYSFNEGSGTTVRDRSGNGRAGQIIGAIYVPSPRGYALRLDGVDDQVEYAGADGFRIHGSFTLAIWLRADPEAGAKTTRLVFGDIAGRSVQRNLNVKLDKYQRIHVEWGDGEAYVDLVAQAALLAGGWHHLAVTCAAETMEATLYLDGKSVVRETVPFAASPSGGGRRVRSGYWSEGNAFGGEIDDIKLFTGTLTASEIQLLATSQTEVEITVDAPPTPSLTVETDLAGPVNRQGLVAHYTFAEGTGDRLVDHSGNGNHGAIHGATWCESPWGGALRFDGQDDYVNLGQEESLWFTGDMSIEMWVKTAPVYPDRKHPLLIGSSAEDLAVERHFNLRLDHTKHFRFEWGDGSHYSCVVEKPWFLDGEWKHLAVVVVSGKAYFLYVNGQLVTARNVGLPLTRTRGDDIHIGGWDHGYLRGDIADIRLYSRAISAVEIQRNGGTPIEQCKPLLKASGAYSYHREEFLCDLFASIDAATAHTLSVRVLEPVNRGVVGETRMPISELTGRGGHDYIRLTIPGRSQTDADHILEATLHDKQGNVLHHEEVPVPYAAPPDWLHAKAGVTDRVLPPYTPCELTREGDDRLVATWGRRHRFGQSGVLTQIETAGQALLAGPVGFLATAGGRQVTWSRSAWEQAAASPASVRFRKRSAASSLALNTDLTIEYDGFMTFECVLSAQQETELQCLSLDIPLVAETARLFHAWPVSKAGYSGALSRDWGGPFKPVIWIGDETRGLSWVCESEQNWHPAGPGRTVEVLHRDKVTLLRLNLVGKELLLSPGRELRYTFGLQATPVRPMTRTFWDMRIHRQRPYAHEYEWVNKRIGGVPALEYYADNGARALLVWRWWDVFGYTLPFGHEKRFPDLVKACHDHGLKLVPYAIGFLLSDAAPEYRVFRRDMLTDPEKGFTGVNRLPGLPNQMAYHACPAGLWRDFVTATTARCMDEYGTDGVYLDTTVRPEPCTNALHGCGWTRDDGSRVPTYPVFAIRDLMKRLYAIVTTRKPDGFVDAHIYDCLNVPALAFSTGYWNGEQLANNDVKVESLPLDRFRTEFMGHNIGVPGDLLFYKLRDYESSMAIAILHDVPVRCEKDSDFDTIAQIYRIRDGFGCDQAAFHGYWESGLPIVVKGEQCHVSYWQHPVNGLLVAVSNLGLVECTAGIALNATRLGLGGEILATDMRRNERPSVTGSDLAVKLPPQSWTLITIRNR